MENVPGVVSETDADSGITRLAGAWGGIGAFYRIPDPYGIADHGGAAAGVSVEGGEDPGDRLYFCDQSCNGPFHLSDTVLGGQLPDVPSHSSGFAGSADGLIHAADMQTFMAEVGRLGLQLGGSFFLGGALFGVIAAAIGYICTYQAAVRFRKKLAARRAARAKVPEKNL